MTGTLRVRALVLAALLVPAGSCNDGPVAPVALSSVPIVSDPGTPSATAAAGASAIASSGEPESLVFISLPPGSVQSGASATIANRRTGAAATATIVDGGFDPVALPAVAGDTIDVEVRGAGGQAIVSMPAAVPATRPPRVVRTRPPRGKTDVPLNTRIEVVFSEPIDPGTLTDASMQLLRDGVAVTARLEFLDASRVTALLIPLSPLLPERAYELAVSQQIRDRDAQALEAPLSVDFTTASATATFGTLRVTVAGEDPTLDTQGYVVHARGLEVPIHRADTVDVTLGTGTDTVRLSGVAPDCSVQDGSEREVSIVEGDTTWAHFYVSCGGGGTTGTVQVRTVAAGIGLDPDGYAVELWQHVDGSLRRNSDGGGSYGVPSNGSSRISGMISGEYQIEIMRMAPNCRASTDRTLRFTVENGAEVAIQITAECTPTGTLAFVDVVDDNHDVYTINANGSARTRLTSHPARDIDPAWSPDGKRIAFSSDREGLFDIYLMDADGGNVSRLTTEGGNRWPTWSPDGGRIAYTHMVADTSRIHVVNVDGSGVANLSGVHHRDLAPAWSPDGGSIAFSGSRDGQPDYDIYVMNADGTGASRLTGTPFHSHWDPAWSPDGLYLTYSLSFWASELGLVTYTIVAARDGTPVRSVATNSLMAGRFGDPAWSPDGRAIALSSEASQIHLQAADGVPESGNCCPEPLTSGWSPSWRPLSP